MDHQRNKQLAKNTIYLYLRMIVVMIVSLFTTRVVLKVLGETDYGIYNIIGGVIILFSFLNSALQNATQRFLSYNLGKNDIDEYNRVYTASFICYLCLGIIIIILGETIGLWFVNTRLTIPEGSLSAANYVYQFTIITFVIKLLRIPFEASVISNEKMSLYAYISIVETLLNLVMVLLLVVLPGNKLILYAFLMFIVSVGITTTFFLICHLALKNKFVKHFEYDIFKDILSFSSWTLLGSSANILARQGGNIIINIFYGVVVNAAYGISTQINAAITSLVNSFQIAFRPQIVKLYANGEREELFKLTFRTSLLSYYLLLVLFMPLVFNINPILKLWLFEIPEYTSKFAILLLVYSLIDALQAPLFYLISATGKIKIYQIWLSSLLILNIPLSWLFLKLGFSPTIVLYVYVCLNFISALIRVLYVKFLINYPSKDYFYKIIIPCIKVTIISLLISFLSSKIFLEYKFGFVINIFIILIVTGFSEYFIGLNTSERNIIKSTIKKVTIQIFHLKNK